MRRIIALFLVVAGAAFADPAQAYRLVDSEAGFAIEFPAEPSLQAKSTAETPVSRLWNLEQEQGKRGWAVNYDKNRPQNPHAKLTDILPALMKNKRVSRNAVISAGKVTGRELIVSDREATSRYRIFQPTPTELVLLVYVGPFGSEKGADVSAFMDSFQFVGADAARMATQAAPAKPPQAGNSTAFTAERERALKPKETFKECDVCPEMVVIPAGSFMMGTPEGQGFEKYEWPQHKVSIARPFAAGKFEITVDQFAAFVAETGFTPGTNCTHFNHDDTELDNRTWRDPGYPQRGNHPVVCINWLAADAYTVWLSGKTGKTYRLLSEAEWEYAARAGSAAKYSFGNNDDAFCRHGNGLDRTAKKAYPKTWGIMDCTDGHVFAAPVGSYPANAFGLHDMHGNVAELTEDCWNDSYNGAPADGSAWISLAACADRTERGGGFSDTGVHGLGAAARTKVLFPYNINVSENSNTGFRVARSLER